MIISGDKFRFSPTHPQNSTITLLSHFTEFVTLSRYNSSAHSNDMPSPLSCSRYYFLIQPSRVSPPPANACPSLDPAAVQHSDSASQIFPPAKELAESGHRVGSTPLLTNDQKSWPGMKRDVSCNHLLPSPEQRSSGEAREERRGAWLGDARCPRAPGGAAAAP